MTPGAASRAAASGALGAFVRKEARHLLRDRRTLAILLLMPLVQVLLFGFVVRTEVERVRLAVVEPVPDAATRALRHRFAAAGLFDVVAVLRTDRPLPRLFASGRAQQALVLPAGFADRLAGGEPAPVLVVTDAADPNTGSVMRAHATTVVRRYEQELRARRPGAGGAPGAVGDAVGDDGPGAPPGGPLVAAETRMRFNPTLASAHLFVPGLIAFVLTIVSALMASVSLTREKETGTMEILLVSPLRPWQIVAGKVLPYLALGFANVLTVLAAARLVFGVPVRGSVTLLLAECLLFITTSLALGVLIATRTSSQRVALTASLMGLMMPTLMLSGFMFPLDSLPAPLRALSTVVPARWFLLVVRGIMLKGVGLAHLWQETLVLGGMTALLLGASARRLDVRLPRGQ